MSKASVSAEGSASGSRASWRLASSSSPSSPAASFPPRAIAAERGERYVAVVIQSLISSKFGFYFIY